MDLIAGVEGVEVLGLVQVPEHGGTVLATGGAEGAIGRDGDGVDVAGVTDVVGLQAAGSELPDLDRGEKLSVLLQLVQSDLCNVKKIFSLSSSKSTPKRGIEFGIPSGIG